MLTTTLICWLAFAFVIWTVDPGMTDWLGFTLFYMSLFLSLVGTTAIIGFIVRFIGLKHELAFRSVRDAFRQSFLFALLIVVALLLLSKNLFSWLNLFFLVAGLSVLEYFLISYGNPSRPKQDNNELGAQL